MSTLPPTFNFPKAEEHICRKWSDEDTFKSQNRLSEERGDKVSQQDLWATRCPI